MKCRACGADNPADSKFCMTCGNVVGGEPTPAVMSPVPSPESTSGSSAMPPPPPPPWAPSEQPEAAPDASVWAPSPAPDDEAVTAASPDTAAANETAAANDMDMDMGGETDGQPARQAEIDGPPPNLVDDHAGDDQKDAEAEPLAGSGFPPPTAPGPPPAGPPPPAPPSPGASAPAAGAWRPPPAGTPGPAPYGAPTQSPPGYGGYPAPPPAAPGWPAPAQGVPPTGTPGPPPPGYFRPAPNLPTDPHGVGAGAARLSNGARKSGRVSILVAAALLEGDERVLNLVQGIHEGTNATVLLTDKRLLLVNDRDWQPKVESVPVTTELTVQGWQDGRTASLIFQSPSVSLTVERIVDVAIAHEMAAAVRGRAGNGS